MASRRSRRRSTCCGPGRTWATSGLEANPATCAAWAAEPARAQAKVVAAAMQLPTTAHAPQGGRQIPAPPTPHDAAVEATRSTMVAAQSQVDARPAPPGTTDWSVGVPGSSSADGPPSSRRRTGPTERTSGATDGTGATADVGDIEMGDEMQRPHQNRHPRAAPFPECKETSACWEATCGWQAMMTTRRTHCARVMADLLEARRKLTRLWAGQALGPEADRLEAAHPWRPVAGLCGSA